MTHTHVSSHPQVKIWKKTQTCGVQTPSLSTLKANLRKKKKGFKSVLCIQELDHFGYTSLSVFLKLFPLSLCVLKLVF